MRPLSEQASNFLPGGGSPNPLDVQHAADNITVLDQKRYPISPRRSFLINIGVLPLIASQTKPIAVSHNKKE